MRGRTASDLVRVRFLVNKGDAVGTGFGFGREGCVGFEWLFNGGAADCFFGAVLFFLNGDG